MIYVIYFFAAGFLLIAGFMYFAYFRSRHFGLLLMATTYAVSGLLAYSLRHWWPLVLGFVLAWALRMLGLEPKIENPEEDGSRKEEGNSEENRS
jgi:hypothetical protein